MAGLSALNILEERLSDIRGLGLERKLTPAGSQAGPSGRVNGRRTLVMSSNDYLGLSGHPRIRRAAAEASAENGAGSGGSRLISGTLNCHVELEQKLASFKKSESALCFSAGYLANLSVIAGLAGKGDLILSDALNHASIIDGARLSRAEVKVYPHSDVAAARRILEKTPCQGLRMIVSDGVFSMDGDLAPIPELTALAEEFGALLVVDDAHATGVWGQNGRGSLEHFNLEPGPCHVMVGTFSKSLGGLGGFTAAPDLVIKTLVNRARAFIYTTAPPPAQAAACLESLSVMDDEPWRRKRVHHLSGLLREGMKNLGFTLCSDQGPIVPILIGPADKTCALGRSLLDQGILAPAIRPPTVPKGESRIRFTLSAAHSEQDVETALNALKRAKKEAGL